MAGKATIVAQVYSYTISNYAKERKKIAIHKYMPSYQDLEDCGYKMGRIMAGSACLRPLQYD